MLKYPIGALAVLLGSSVVTTLPAQSVTSPTTLQPLPGGAAAPVLEAGTGVLSGRQSALLAVELPPADLPSSTLSSSGAETPAVSAGPVELPDDPDSLLLHAAIPDPLADQRAPTGQPVAPKLTKYIPSGFTAQTITAHDKVLLGLRDLYSPLNFIAMVVSAGYEQVLNGEPNYGTDRGAFGERLGAAAIRESTQGFFTDSVFAPLLHEDPRYYIKGNGHSFLSRLTYAATRPLITRTDSGHSTVNGALLAGYAASSALTYAYYPSINQNFHDTASTFGGAIGGAALGYVVSEFSDNVLKVFHHAR